MSVGENEGEVLENNNHEHQESNASLEVCDILQGYINAEQALGTRETTLSGPQEGAASLQKDIVAPKALKEVPEDQPA